MGWSKRPRLRSQYIFSDYQLILSPLAESGFPSACIRIFSALANDKSKNLPYNPEMAEQRYRYGSSIIRRGPAEVDKQTAYEQDAQAKVSSAMQRREDEKRKLEAKEVCPHFFPQPFFLF